MHYSISLPDPTKSVSLKVANRWDRIGVALSGLCAIHCLALPVLLVVLPFVDAHLLHNAVHPVMAMFVAPVAIRSLRKETCGAGLLRFGLLMVCMALPAHMILGDGFALVLTLAGSALLVVGHRCNLRCRHAADNA